MVPRDEERSGTESRESPGARKGLTRSSLGFFESSEETWTGEGRDGAWALTQSPEPLQQFQVRHDWQTPARGHWVPAPCGMHLVLRQPEGAPLTVQGRSVICEEVEVEGSRQRLRRGAVGWATLWEGRVGGRGQSQGLEEGF